MDWFVYQKGFIKNHRILKLSKSYVDLKNHKFISALKVDFDANILLFFKSFDIVFPSSQMKYEIQPPPWRVLTFQRLFSILNDNLMM